MPPAAETTHSTVSISSSLDLVCNPLCPPSSNPAAAIFRTRVCYAPYRDRAATHSGGASMMSELRREGAGRENRQHAMSALAPPSRRRLLRPLTGALTMSVLCSSVAAAQGNSPTQLRRFIDRQVGGIQKMMVPTRNTDLPQPRLADGSPDPELQTTEAKRYLGKLLFHEPARATRIIPEFGGIVDHRGTASCGTCHLGEAASKAGTLLNFATGGEGRGYTDAKGNFVARRRPRPDMPILRQTPLFPGDARVDELPTLTDIYLLPDGTIEVNTPARGRRPLPGDVTDTRPPVVRLLATGRLDALDSVARNPLSVIGAAFNNRLLFGGLAGEPDDTHGALNPFHQPAQENVALLLLDAHRLLDDDPLRGPVRFQSAVLEQIPVYRKLFRDAFPAEAATAPGCVPEIAPVPGACDALINNLTIVRATATFLRTVVTRNTPWDRFLAGENGALTAAQRRGAKLFFTSAPSGGAGCFTCHSGPMLNKQVDDPDLAGVGRFVEENFFNLGLGDHPLQALNRAARNDPNHLDEGRREVTFRDSDAFKFRTLTLRQLKDAKFFFHNGSLTSVTDVVRYFNAGVPQNAQAAAADTFTRRFSHPRGPGSPRGLGLTDDQVGDLTDFIENGLYDPAFVHFDPASTTDTLMLNERDVTYSVYRPDLAVLGAVDGRPGSGRPQDNDDALSRRDAGLEFLDVTASLKIERIASRTDERRRGREDVLRVSNISSSVVDTHLVLVLQALADRQEVVNANGITTDGDPYIREFLNDGVLRPGESITVRIRLKGPSHNPAIDYQIKALSGQGNP
jgi:cytochrome c peroxidase